MIDKTIEVKKRTVLIAEDSRVFSRILKMSIEINTEFETVIVESFSELKAIVESKQYHFFVSLLDLNLPDAPPEGELVDYVVGHNIPTIVFTGKFDDDLRDRIQSKGIVDYVLKKNPSSVEYIVTLLKQLSRNTCTKALIVDDSRVARDHIRRLLLIYRFIVLEAENGKQALSMVKENKDIMLVIVDFNMPEMDGVELTEELRTICGSQDMVIIGMSAYGHKLLSARFLKVGGNDFINKPFLEEEFFCRINQNLRLLQHIKDLNYIAACDFLTGLYNRRHFFDKGKKLFSRAFRAKKGMAVAIMDIDFFKKVNDNYGHDAGDMVLKRMGEVLSNNFRAGDLVARLGGEEFCFFLLDVEKEQSLNIFENLRRQLEECVIELSEEVTIQITVSIGVCVSARENLDVALAYADKLLYQAKENGRNQVVLG